MDLRKLQRTVIDALEDIKAQDILIYDTTELTSDFDRVIIATGNSNRQTRALASHVHNQAKASGVQTVKIEGEETGEWVLVDLGDIIVHIMQPATRQYYNLEDVWGQKRVHVKLGAGHSSSTNAAFEGNNSNNPAYHSNGLDHNLSHILSNSPAYQWT